MEVTTYLAHLWGPVLLAVGIGFFVSRSYYVKVYHDLQKAPFAVLFFGMFAMAAAIAQLLAHNTWSTLPEILISFLGWSLLLKGIVCVVWPRLADKGGDWAIDSKLVPTAGAIALLIGGYLTWFAYLSYCLRTRNAHARNAGPHDQRCAL